METFIICGLTLMALSSGSALIYVIMIDSQFPRPTPDDIALTAGTALIIFVIQFILSLIFIAIGAIGRVV